MDSVSQSGGSVLDKIVDSIIPPQVVSFVNTILYEKSWIIINYWSFVHFCAGMIFYFIKPSFRSWLIFNIVYELVECLLGLGGNPLFVEEFVDTLWDIVWALGGFILMKIFKERIRTHFLQ